MKVVKTSDSCSSTQQDTQSQCQSQSSVSAPQSGQDIMSGVGVVATPKKIKNAESSTKQGDMKEPLKESHGSTLDALNELGDEILRGLAK